MLTEKESSVGSSYSISNFCNQFCLTNTISVPTRVTASTKTLLDVILVSHPERFVSGGTLRLGISDHDLIYIVRKQRLPKPNVRSIECRSMKNFDEPAFLSSLSDIPWDTAYTFDHVNDIWCHWESLLKEANDHHAPLKRVNLKSNHLPWINPAIQKQMRIRNLLYKKFRRIPTNENWNKYRCQRNKVTALEGQSVKNLCFDAASVSSRCSPGLFWKKLRPLLPSSKSSVNTSSICLLGNSRIVPDTSASLNEYFTSPTINESLLTFSVDELSSHASVVNIETKAPRINFYFHPVRMARVSEILSNLNVRKPAGTNGIPPKLLKIAAPVIAGPMTKLFNYCIDVGEWPCQWKLSNVTPVHKKDDETSKTNYRPISVLSVIPKVFEKLKFDQLYSVFILVLSDNVRVPAWAFLLLRFIKAN